MRRKLTRFLVVGAGCALLYFGLAWMFQSRGGLPPFLATTAAYVVSFSIAYVLQRVWTFHSETTHRVTLPRYAVVQALAALLTATATQAVAHLYPNSPSVAVAAMSTVLAGGLSFALSSTWVFPNVPNPPQ